jgi:membrane-bound lytic murein transglycosylase F
VVDLLRMVDEGQIDLTLVDSNELAMNQVYFPNVRVAFDLGDAATSAGRWPPAKTTACSTRSTSSSTRPEERHPATPERPLLRPCRRARLCGRLHLRPAPAAAPAQVRKHFKSYAKVEQVDWRLLAAIGYQESMWQPEVTSKTGVRGLMMLTQRTAQAMGVSNRLDPKQSIQGGAKYFMKIKEELDDSIRSRIAPGLPWRPTTSAAATWKTPAPWPSAKA